MSKVISFVRKISNNENYTQSQKIYINKYIEENKIILLNEIEIEINSSKDEKNLLQLLEKCSKDNIIIVYDLNVFGRTIERILEIVNFFLDNQIRIIVIKQNLDLIDSNDMLTKMILGVVSMTIALEKDLMSLRTKEALNLKKEQGISLGKPKGTIQKSKFDKQRDKIEELLALGLSVRKISKILGYSNHIGLNNYVKKRSIREKVQENSVEIAN
ncbi:MAG: recombinase family protein [Campylobacteraceae bacterium]|nr:recombinase family protein [Campylobacteraceae bacterium]